MLLIVGSFKKMTTFATANENRYLKGRYFHRRQ